MLLHQAWRLSNDLLVEPGGQPWIAEMYGFSFGAASAGVAFHWNRTAMIYPRDYPEGVLPLFQRLVWYAQGLLHLTMVIMSRFRDAANTGT